MAMRDKQLLLLHGLGRTRRSMHRLARAGEKRGYTVLNLGYPGIRLKFTELVSRLNHQLDEIDPQRPLFAIAHSLGGLLLRALMAERPQFNWQACVMLGTPNQGTQIASYFSSHAILKWLTPPVVSELTPYSSLIKNLPEPGCATGIIAGTQSQCWLIPVSWFYPRATANALGDGVVELSNTRCRTMSDFLQLPLHHSFMPCDSRIIEQSFYFLEQHRFQR